MAEKQGIAAYDVDGTLLEGTISDRAFWMMHEQDVINVSDETLEELALLREQGGPPYMHNLVQAYIDSTRGVDLKTIDRTAEALAEEDAANIYPIMQEQLAEDRETHEIIIVSGAPDHFLQPLARRLGSKIATGSRYFTARGRIHEARTPTDRSKEKHLPLGKIATKLGLGIERAYGDTISDASMLRMAVGAYAVNPQPELRAVAEYEQWEIIECRET